MRELAQLFAIASIAACGFSPTTSQSIDAAMHGDVRPLDARPDGPPDAPPDAPRCPATYAAIPNGPAGSVYQIHGITEATTFPSAMTTCAGANTYVAIVDSAAELTALTAAIPNNINFSYYWDGITDQAVEGTWVTVLGTPATYLPWYTAQNQPDGGTAQNCAAVNTDPAALNDAGCTAYNFPFACECNP